MSFEIIPLRWERYAMVTNIPAGLLSNTTAERDSYDNLRDLYGIKIQTDILCDDREPEIVECVKTVESCYPATTWQMFKSRNSDRWFMRWIARRHPVVMHVERKTVVCTVGIQRRDIYPSARYTRELGTAYHKIVIQRDITERF
jgi:hypothetical protein